MDVRSALASSAIQTLRPSSAFVDTVNDEGRCDCRPCSLNLRPSPSCSGLQDSSGPSTTYQQVLSWQLRSGGSSSEYAPDRPSSLRWNDRESDHLSKHEGVRHGRAWPRWTPTGRRSSLDGCGHCTPARTWPSSRLGSCSPPTTPAACSGSCGCRWPATARCSRTWPGWATGYNLVAMPLAVGVLARAGITLASAVGAILMSASTIVVALNAQLRRRLDLRRT